MVSLTKTTKAVSSNDVKREWHLVDVNGQILGRVSSGIAKILQGKNKINYVPYLDMGDNVVVVNAKKIVVTGRKAQTKEYLKYSGYPGGLRKRSFEQLLQKNPSAIIREAVSGMLPKNKLRDRRMARLFIFPDEKHQYKDKFK